MKTNSPLWSLKAWQTVGPSPVSFWLHSEWTGSGIFRRRDNYTILERYFIPFNPQTYLQQEGRSMFLNAVASWQALSDVSKQSWNYYQDYRRRRPVMSGYNLYISKFLLSAGNPVIPPSGRKGEY